MDLLAAYPDNPAQIADQVEARLNGEVLTVRRYNRFDEPLYVVQAEVDPEATNKVLLLIKRKLKEVTLHPKRLGLKLEQEKKGLSVSFSGAPYLVVECDAVGYIVLLFEPKLETPEGPGVLFAGDRGIVSDPQRVQTEALQAALDEISASDELSTLRLPTGVYRSGDLNFPSNVRLHLDAGALLKASDNADDIGDPSFPGASWDRASFLHANGSENVSITGHGILDGNRAVLDMGRYYKGLLLFRHCKNVHFEGVSFVDSCGWGVTPRYCDGVVAKRVKILNNRPHYGCINTDGLNPDGCTDVRIEEVFFHTGDDAVAVKSTNYSGEARSVSNVRIRDLLAINNSATAKIGTETMGAVMEEIHFENVDAVRTCRLCVVDAYDLALIRNCSFRECHVHELDGNWEEDGVVDIRMPRDGMGFRPLKAEAIIDTLLIESVHAEDPEAQASALIRMDDGEPALRNLSVKNLTCGGKPASIQETRI